MGALDYIILTPTIIALLVSLTLLLISLKHTKDEVARKHYMRTYTPMIALCSIVLVFYFALLEVGRFLG